MRALNVVSNVIATFHETNVHQYGKCRLNMAIWLLYFSLSIRHVFHMYSKLEFRHETYRTWCSSTIFISLSAHTIPYNMQSLWIGLNMVSICTYMCVQCLHRKCMKKSVAIENYFIRYSWRKIKCKTIGRYVYRWGKRWWESECTRMRHLSII